MSFILRNCVRCGASKVQLVSVGFSNVKSNVWEGAFSCVACHQTAIYSFRSNNSHHPENHKGDIDAVDSIYFDDTAIFYMEVGATAGPEVPSRIADLFRQGSSNRLMGQFDAAGAMFRKTLDVATKYIYTHDPRLAEKNPADALRVRINGLGGLGILDPDIVELADVVAVDGNDAIHEMEPYGAEEAEALEELTIDLLDRLFVRPARIAAVKAKQIAAGVRKP